MLPTLKMQPWYQVPLPTLRAAIGDRAFFCLRLILPKVDRRVSLREWQHGSVCSSSFLLVGDSSCQDILAKGRVHRAIEKAVRERRMVADEKSIAVNVKQSDDADLPVEHVSEREDLGRGKTVESQISSLNRFSLSSLLMITSLVAVICWGFSVHRVLGSIMFMIIAPALARTIVIARYYGRDNKAAGNISRIMEFVDSIGAVIIAAMGAALFGSIAGLVAVSPGIVLGQLWERGGVEYPGLKTGWIVGWITFAVAACLISFVIILASMPAPGRILRGERYFLAIAVVASYGIVFFLFINKVLLIRF